MGDDDRATGPIQRGTMPAQRGTVPWQRTALPVIAARCRQFVVDRVPSTYLEFEALVEQRVALCVQSRTDHAHRERALVRGNVSLASVWAQLAPGQRARIVPEYVWGANRVEAISFSSPDRRPSASPGPTSRVDQGVGPKPTVGAIPGTSSRGPTARDPRRPWVIIDPPPPRTGPGIPGLEDILDLARRTEEVLRRSGAKSDADRMAALIAGVAAGVVSLGLLIGAYALSLRYFDGIAVQWGWTLTSGYDFQRRWARGQQVVTDLNTQIREMEAIARRHQPVLAGAAVHWPTYPRVPPPDPQVVGQMDVLACGPACVEIVLGARGINATQLEAAIIARGAPGTQVDWVSDDGLLKALRTLDPRGDWQAGAFPVNTNPSQGVASLCQRGPWIAWVVGDRGHHAVVVTGLDLKKGHVLIADPWLVSEPRRGKGLVRSPAQFGSSYAVDLATFLRSWPSYYFVAGGPA